MHTSDQAKATLEAVEEIHYPTTATYFSEDGTRELVAEVCAHCDDDPERTAAATWPCETIDEANYQYEQDTKAALANSLLKPFNI